MFIDRPALKQQAKDTIGSSVPNVVSVGAVYLVLSIIIALLSSRLLGGGFSEADLQRYLNYVLEENYRAALELISDYAPSPGAYIIELALRLMLATVSMGFVIFLINTIRKTAPCFGNLLDGFGMFWRILLLNLLIGLFVALWSLLLVVPGIIAAYSYRQAKYLLIEHPDMSPFQCMMASKEMMRGHKSELFMLDLSFLGWWLLCMLPVVGYGAQVWALPYIGMTNALYYERLCGQGSV